MHLAPLSVYIQYLGKHAVVVHIVAQLERSRNPTNLVTQPRRRQFSVHTTHYKSKPTTVKFPNKNINVYLSF